MDRRTHNDVLNALGFLKEFIPDLRLSVSRPGDGVTRYVVSLATGRDLFHASGARECCKVIIAMTNGIEAYQRSQR